MSSTVTALVGLASSTITVMSFGVYLLQTIRGHIKPHAISWLLWGIVPLAVAIIQSTQHAGLAAIVPLITGIMSLTICGCAFFKGSREFTRFDKAFAALSAISLATWLIVRSPALAITLLTFTDMMAFAPTVRKTWHKPQSEHWFMYGMCGFRNILALLIMQNCTFTNVCYPLVWIIADISFCIMLFTRRRSLPDAPNDNFNTKTEIREPASATCTHP